MSARSLSSRTQRLGNLVDLLLKPVLYLLEEVLARMTMPVDETLPVTEAEEEPGKGEP